MSAAPGIEARQGRDAVRRFGSREPGARARPRGRHDEAGGNHEAAPTSSGPLSQAAVELLRTIRSGVPADCPQVFPGDIKGNPLSEIQTFWERARAKAKLGDTRIHDPRHTFVSLLVSCGMTLPMVGHLLGHTQA